MNRALAIIFTLLVIASLTTFCAPTPSPEQYAAATATVIRAYSVATADAHYNESLAQANYARQTASAGEAFATATAVAVSAHATATAASVSAQATATAASVNVQATAAIAMAQATRNAMDTHATATAIPMQLSVTASATARDSIGVWVWLGLGTLGALALVMLLFAVVSWTRTRARIIPRDTSGQLPAFWHDNTLVEPSRMLGGAITLPRGDALARLARVVHYLRTGQVQPQERGHVETYDGNADADHYLAAAQASLGATAVAAMFRPDNAERGRATKLDIIKDGGGVPLASALRGTAPPTRVIVAGDSAVRAIAEQLGDRLPLLDAWSGMREGERAEREGERAKERESESVHVSEGAE